MAERLLAFISTFSYNHQDTGKEHSSPGSLLDPKVHWVSEAQIRTRKDKRTHIYADAYANYLHIPFASIADADTPVPLLAKYLPTRGDIRDPVLTAQEWHDNLGESLRFVTLHKERARTHT